MASQAQPLLHHEIPGDIRLASVPLCEERMLLVSAEAMGQLRLDLFRGLGETLTRQLLIRHGHACGRHDALRLRRSRDWSDEREWLLTSAVTHTLRGAARVEITSCELDRETSLFHLEGIWHDSYEVEQHLAHFGLSGAPVCWTLAGYFSGYGSAVWGDEVICEEITPVSAFLSSISFILIRGMPCGRMHFGGYKGVRRLRIVRALQIRQHVDRIVRIVNQMMDFARPPNMEWRLIDIHTVIDRALEIARYQRGFKHLKIVREFRKNPAHPLQVGTPR